MKANFRKIICFILLICFVSIMVIGCVSSDDDDDRTDSKKNSSESGTKEKENPSPTNQEGDTPVKPTESNPEITKEPISTLSYTISDEIIVDNDMCTFKIVKAEDDEYWGFQLKVYCENKTSDKKLTFSMDDVSVNGYMSNPYWMEQVAPGKKSNDNVTFSSLDNIVTPTVDELSFTLRVYDSDDWMADDYLKEAHTVYPTGLTKEEFKVPDRKTSPKEKVIVDNDQIYFVIIEEDQDDFWGYVLTCYMENKTDKTLMFTWDDVSVNGFMTDPFWASEVAPGKRCYGRIIFSEDDFEENNITDVETISASMRVYDPDDWMAKDVFNGELNYTP